MSGPKRPTHDSAVSGHRKCYFPSVSLNSDCISFQESSSAFLSYFMPGLFALSAPGTVKLWTAPG